MKHNISIYFFHTGRGQSIAIRFKSNEWLVFDAYVAGVAGKTSNPALDLLSRHQDAADFRLRAVVLSHFHLDHHLGLPAIIRHFRDRGQLEMVVIPATWDLFRILLEIQSEGGKLAPLDDLLQLLDDLDDGGRPPMVVDGYDYLLPASFKGIQRHKRWVFCFHPRKEDVIKAIGDEGFVRKRRPFVPPLDLEWIRSHGNHYCYVFGVGVGREGRDPHLLLTADVSGKAFNERTRELRDRLVPESRGSLLGPARRLENLVIEDPEMPGGLRIRPLHSLTVPHHGSAGDLLGEHELQWWLNGPAARQGRCPVAVVQGNSSAFREETLNRFGAAGFRIFASSQPTKIGSEETYGSELGRRLLGRPGDLLVSGKATKTTTTGHEPGYLALHGSSGGLGRIEGRNFYEVEWPSCEIKFHATIDESLDPSPP